MKQVASLATNTDDAWAEANHIEAFCYICGRRFESLTGCLTTPPDYRDITRLDQIRPVDTCNTGRCCEREWLRTDALTNHVLQLNKTQGASHA